MQLAPYLFFDGTCEAALNFYEHVFGGSAERNRWSDAPHAEGMPEEHKQRIMHATFTAPGLTFMASDSEATAGEMQRVALSLATRNVDEGARIFAALAEGGSIQAPYEKSFWGATFGMLTDRFGVRWMVNAG